MDVIEASEQPVGVVVDFFYRVEFQDRGSPHLHALMWVRDSPKYGRCTDSEYVKFIDNYNTCKLPNKQTQSELYKIVTECQFHSKSHTKSCKPQKNKSCRYGFPKQPAERTFIASQDELNLNLLTRTEEVKAQNVLKSI